MRIIKDDKSLSSNSDTDSGEGVNKLLPVRHHQSTNGDCNDSQVPIKVSELSPTKKEKYLQFLAENEIKFTKGPEGVYEATISLVGVNEVVEKPEHNETNSRLRYMMSPGARTQSLGKKNKPIHIYGESNCDVDLSTYPSFCSLIDNRDILKPRLRSIIWLTRAIDDLYDEMFKLIPSAEKCDVGGANSLLGPNLIESTNSFPCSVFEYYSKQYGLRQLIDQNCWDLIYNVHSKRRDYTHVEIFARFMEEYYTKNELLYFLYVRSNIETELMHSRHSNWVDSTGSKRTANPRPTTLTWRQANNIALAVYSSSSDRRYQSFISSIDSYAEVGDDGEQYLEIAEFLKVALFQYHDETSQSNDEVRHNTMDKKERQENIETKPKLGSMSDVELSRSADNMGMRVWEKETEAKTSTLGKDILSQREESVPFDEFVVDVGIGIEKFLEAENESTIRDEHLMNKELEITVNITPKTQSASSDFNQTVQSQIDQTQIEESIPLSPPPPPPLKDDIDNGLKPIPSPTRDPPTPSPTRDPPSPHRSFNLKESIEGPASHLVNAEIGHDGFDSTMSTTEQVLYVLRTTMQRASERYLQTLMQSARSLPDDVTYELYREVRSKLEIKVRDIINDVAGARRTHTHTPYCEAVPSSCIYLCLQKQFRDILRSCYERSRIDYHVESSIADYCQAILESPEVRQEVEPLVALLVTYATARIN